MSGVPPTPEQLRQILSKQVPAAISDVLDAYSTVYEAAYAPPLSTTLGEPRHLGDRTGETAIAQGPERLRRVLAARARAIDETIGVLEGSADRLRKAIGQPTFRRRPRAAMRTSRARGA